MPTAITLNGITATDARVTLPAWGVPYADVSVDGEHTLSGGVSLVIADFTFQATVLAGGPAAGRSYFRLVGGKGGWSKTLSRTSYSNDGGVKLSTVLLDAAAACGETIDTATLDTTTRLGPYYVRPEGQACTLLEQLTPNAWYVGEDGQTRFGKRPKTTLDASTPRTSQVDLARGTVTLASDSIASIVPGIVVDGLEAVDVEHEVSAKDGLRSKIWGRSGIGNSRRLAAFRAILNMLDPGRKYRGTYEYRVVTQEGERLNLQAVRVSTTMPDIRRVVVRPGVAGYRGQPMLGSRVLVTFIDQDPARPAVISFEDAEGSGFKPLLTSVDASQTLLLGPSASLVQIAGGGATLARVGDEVTITVAQFTAAAASNGGGPVTIAHDMKATISNSTSVVTSG